CDRHYPSGLNSDDFRRLLASFAGVLPLKRPSDLLAPGFRHAILEHTEGITVRIIRLLESLALEAIQSGRECINKESLTALPSFVPLLSMEGENQGAFSR